ncbi:MAG: D-aminoacylase [Gemmatimonadetes bacterium]|nr:D-aminoacylase [Gemmatimonadota bacterium]
MNARRFPGALALCCLLLAACSERYDYDILIRGGMVIDGTGAPPFAGDVGIRDGHIVLVGAAGDATARKVIDAAGLYVAPGFIDGHSHAADGLATPELSEARPLLAQGVTTVVVNPDGGGPVDLGRQRQELLAASIGVNVAQFIGQGSVRREVLGMADRAPSAEELAGMKELVRAGMEAGAVGLSTGLFYTPGGYASTEEVIELSKVAAEYGGVYHSHLRDEGDYTEGGVVGSVDELIRISREAGLPGIVTHVKAYRPGAWGKAKEIVEHLERARQEGLEIYADLYPYDACGGSIQGVLVPNWAEEGGREGFLRRLQDPKERARVRAGMQENIDRGVLPDRIFIRGHRADPSLEGKTLQQIADERGQAPVDAAMDIEAAGGASLVQFLMTEEDVQAFIRQSWTMTASDGGLVPMGEGVPHPRNYSTFPRRIRRYAVDLKLDDLASAIRSMTSLPASVLRIPERGELRPNRVADIVVFDLDRLRDNTDYDRPHQLAEGMVHVLVGGAFAMENGEFTGAKAGQVLGRAAAKPRGSAATGR